MDLSNWDQRETLAPPPLPAWSRIRKGINVADELYATIPTSMLRCHDDTQVDKLPKPSVPKWVNWKEVREGQLLLQKNYVAFTVSLVLALGSGFSMNRFSEVLDASGYSSSARAATARYHATLVAITNWIFHPLDDPNGQARKSLTYVRSLHELARRATGHLFDADCGEGVALSQYDMSTVLVAFSGVSMEVAKEAFGADWGAEETRKTAPFWRLVGYFLGIDDKYNVCNDVDEMMQCTLELKDGILHMIQTSRPSTDRLIQAAYIGLGNLSGLGESFWFGALRESLRIGYGMSIEKHSDLYQDLQSEYLIRQPYDGFAFGMLRLFASRPVGLLAYPFSKINTEYLADRTTLMKVYKTDQKVASWMEDWGWQTIGQMMLLFIALSSYCSIMLGKLIEFITFLSNQVSSLETTQRRSRSSSRRRSRHRQISVY